MTRRTIALLVVALLTLAACGDDTSVGTGIDLDNLGAEDSDGAIRGTTSTTAEPEVEAQQEAPAPTPETTAPPATAPPETAPPQTAPAEQPSIVIGINSDTSGVPQFDPPVAAVYAGSLVRFQNNDSAPRSVVAGDGSFDSGPIAPGASWDHRADAAGSFNYTDGTRPYAQGKIEVHPR
jgi:plastocyanin/predicted small secreted protein